MQVQLSILVIWKQATTAAVLGHMLSTERRKTIWLRQLLISGGGSNVGIDLGKSLISAYRYNRSGSDNVKLGAYDKEYFSYDGSGTFICKKECNIKIIAFACAVIGNSETSFNLYYNGNSIANVSISGGCRTADIAISVGSTLRLYAYAERVSGSAVLNVYLK